jgi:thymidylate kinase
VREGYLAEAQLDPARFRIIEAIRPIPDIHQTILASVQEAIEALSVESLTPNT